MTCQSNLNSNILIEDSCYHNHLSINKMGQLSRGAEPIFFLGGPVEGFENFRGSYIKFLKITILKFWSVIRKIIRGWHTKP